MRFSRVSLESQTQVKESDISPLQNKLEENNLSDSDKNYTLNELEVKTFKLENISQHQTREAIIKSKARWHHEGENTMYFLSLKKRHFNTKTIKQLQLGDNSVINTDDKILREAKSFYEKLISTCNPKITSDYNDNFFPEFH